MLKGSDKMAMQLSDVAATLYDEYARKFGNLFENTYNEGINVIFDEPMRDALRVIGDEYRYFFVHCEYKDDACVHVGLGTFAEYMDAQAKAVEFNDHLARDYAKDYDADTVTLLVVQTCPYTRYSYYTSEMDWIFTPMLFKVLNF